MNDLSNPSGKDYLQRARNIAPLIAEYACAIESARRLTPQVVKTLIDGGFYRMLQPRFLGGGELSLAAFCEVIEEIAKADASTAWCLAQCSTCAMAAAYLDRNTAVKRVRPAGGHRRPGGRLRRRRRASCRAAIASPARGILPAAHRGWHAYSRRRRGSECVTCKTH